MKSNKILLMVSLFAVFFSCGKSEEEKKAEAEKMRLEAIQDSIKKVEKQELELFRQDSIAALDIKEYSAKKISGKDQYDDKTELTYISAQLKLNEIKEQAKKEMWTDEQLKQKIKIYKEEFKGGILLLKVERSTIGAANSEWFSIIVKDKDEKEIYREEYESSVPNVSSSVWWNHMVSGIPNRLETPFYVYVVDELSEGEPFKFEVTPVKK